MKLSGAPGGAPDRMPSWIQRIQGSQHPLAGEALRRLQEVGQRPAQQYPSLLQDPGAHVLASCGPGSGPIRALVVLEPLPRRLLCSPFAPFYARLATLLPAPNLAAYCMEEAWWAPAEAWAAAALLDGFISAQAQWAAKVVLTCHLTDAPRWSPLRERLLSAGFKASKGAFCAMRWTLPRAAGHPPSPAPGGPAGQLQVLPLSVSRPTDAAMAEAYNRIFFAGEPRVAPADVAATLALEGMCPELSLVATEGPGAQVVGFILVRRQGAEAEILLMGWAPEYRRRRLTLGYIPLLVQECSRAGVRSLSFTINPENHSILQLVQAHLGAQLEVRRTMLYSVVAGPRPGAIADRPSGRDRERGC